MIEKLEAFRAEWEGRNLVWGVTDCARMVADWVYRMTGENPMINWGDYKDLSSARKTIRDKGYKSFEDAITAHLQPLESHYFAMEGDIIAIKSEVARMPALGIYLAPHAVLAFGAITDTEGNILEGSEQVRRVGMDCATGKAWRPICQQ